MEVFENSENKSSVINLEDFPDFPFICRICLRGGDLRLFEEADHLLDLYVTITKIDVRSTVNAPRNLCNECIKILEDISLFIDISKYNNARQGRHFILKKDLENGVILDGGTSEQRVVETEKTNREYEKNIYEASETCRICSVKCSVTPFEEKAHLMQLFQNITNIDVQAELKFSRRHSICNKCINELEKISSFLTLSLCNDMKLKNTIRKIGTLKIEDCLEKNASIVGTCNNVKFESISERKEVKMENYFDNENKNLHTVLDIKEEINFCPGYSDEQNFKNGLGFCSKINSIKQTFECDTYKNKFTNENTQKIMSKLLVVNLEANFGMKKFECVFCKRSFAESEKLQQHLLIHSEEKPFKCALCEKSYTRKWALANHRFTHSGQKSFKCDCCEKSYAKKDNLKYHILTTHIAEKPFKCDCCERGFVTRQSFTNHLLTHSGQKPFKCDCCDISFHTRTNLKVHMRTHTGEQPFRCNCCEKRFNVKSNLHQHMLTHIGRKLFGCDCCEKTFARKAELKNHFLSTHTGKKPFECDCCEKNFCGNSSLKRHMLTHTGERPFTCDVCRNSFTKKDTLKRHLVTHTGEKPFKCDSCEKCYTDKGNLLHHMLKHTGERLFKCDLCQKSFTRKWYLKEHMITHTREKPFQCNCCGNNFSRRYYLKVHMFTHTGEKPLKCNCGKSFIYKQELERHSLTHTRKIKKAKDRLQ